MSKQISEHDLHLIKSQLPSSWYYLGRSWTGEKKRKFVITKNEILVYFSSKSNQWVALSARCLHMNADLSCGQRLADHIQCPMHQWTYDSEGNVLGAKSKSNHKLQKFAIEEVHGHLMVFLGEKSITDHPFQVLKNVSMSSAIQISARVPQYLQVGNGFDRHHFQGVHGRVVEKISSFYQDNDFISITYQLKNVSSKLSDRIIRVLFSDHVQLKFSVYGGGLIWAEILIGKINYSLITFVHPAAEDCAEATLFSVLKKTNKVFDYVRHLTLRLFIKKFSTDEVKLLEGLNITTSSLDSTQDETLLKFMNWYLQRVTSADTLVVQNESSLNQSL